MLPPTRSQLLLRTAWIILRSLWVAQQTGTRRLGFLLLGRESSRLAWGQLDAVVLCARPGTCHSRIAWHTSSKAWATPWRSTRRSFMFLHVELLICPQGFSRASRRSELCRREGKHSGQRLSRGPQSQIPHILFDEIVGLKRIQSDVRHHSAIQQVYMRLLGLASSNLPSSCWASLSRLHSLCSACCSNTCYQSCGQLSFMFCGEVMNVPWSRSSLFPAVSGKWLQEGWHNLAYAVLLHRNWQRLQRR